MMNHSLTKSMLFLASGNILQKYNAREISKIQGLLKVLPITGTIFLLGLLAIAGTPPFSIFASEVNVFISIFAADRAWLGVILILLLAVIFAGIAATLFKVFYGNVDRNEIPSGETNLPGALAMSVLLIAIIVTGIYMPDGLKDLFLAAQQIVLGG